MKLFFCFIIFSTIALRGFSQQFGVTDDGKRVQLNDDKTWKYLEDSTQAAPKKLDTSIKATYTKPRDASGLIKSAKCGFGFYYNPLKWVPDEIKRTGITESKLKLKNEDAYLLTVAEGISVDLYNLPELVKKTKFNANATNVVMLDEGFRNVNGVKVYYLKYKLKASGINFTYVSYNVSDESGVYQMVGSTSDKLMPKYENELMNLLNGLVKIPSKATN